MTDITTELQRIIDARDEIRTKLISMGLAVSTDQLDDLADAINEIINRGAVSQSLDANTTSYTVPAGYHNGSGTVSITPEEKTATPSTSVQNITPTNGKVLSKVTVSAMPNGTAGTPVATKGNVSNHTISVTPSVTNTPGYIAGGTITGTSVSVAASELVSGTKSINSNGSNIDVTNYEKVNVSVVPSLQSKTDINPLTTSQTIEADSGYYGLSSVEINAMPGGVTTAPASISDTGATLTVGTNTLTLSKTVSVTPSVTTAGYVSSGTAGNSDVSLTGTVATKSADTYYPSASDQTIAASQYLTGAQIIKAVTTTNLSASNILSGVTVKVGDSVDDDRVASVSGSVIIQHYYTGSTVPSSSIGSVGDIYLMS